MTFPIRLLLVDDHTLFRESLVRFLESEPTLVVEGHCASIFEAQELLKASPVDVILLDYDLGEQVGTELLPFMRENAKTARILMLTAGMAPGATLAALNSGIAGVFLKQTGTRQLLEAIERIARGDAWWSAEVLRSALDGSDTRSTSPEATRGLTERQQLVLQGILDGLANKEIAARLEASETSVKASIQELFNKAGVRTRGQLVRVALERFSANWLTDQTPQR